MSAAQTTSTTSSNNNKLSQSNNNNVVALSLIGGSFISLIALTTPFITMQLKSSLPYMSTPRQKVEKALMFLSKRKKNNGSMFNNMSNNCYYSDQKSIDNNVATKHLCTDNHNNNIIVSKRQLHFVDLGSGDGTAVLTAYKLGWHSTGIEMNSTLWLLSSIRRLFSIATFSTMTTTSSNKEINNSIQFKLGNMFNPAISRECLHTADAVMIFGVQPLMSQISKLIENECQSGCYLMSYRFRIPLASSNNVDDDDQEEGKKTRVESNKEEDTGSGIHASLIYDEEEMRIYELHHNKKR